MIDDISSFNCMRKKDVASGSSGEKKIVAAFPNMSLQWNCAESVEKPQKKNDARFFTGVVKNWRSLLKFIKYITQKHLQLREGS